MITTETVLLYTLRYPHLSQLKLAEIQSHIEEYQAWLLEDPDWLAEQAATPDTMEYFDLYLECLAEDENFIKEQMNNWEDDDVPGFR